jgi:hypothetical protein
VSASLYQDLMKSHKDYQFREFRCTGTKCSFKTYARVGVNLECNTAGCRGEVTHRYRISHKKYIYWLMYRLLYVKGVYKPRVDPRNYRVSPTQRREIEKLVSLGSPNNTYAQIAQKSVERTIR